MACFDDVGGMTNANTERIPNQSNRLKPQPEDGGARCVVDQGTLHSPPLHQQLRDFKEPETEARSHAGRLATLDHTTLQIFEIARQPSPDWSVLYG